MRTRIIGSNPVEKVTVQKSEMNKSPADPSVLLVRKHRMGDLVMATSVAHYLMKQQKHVAVATKEEYKTILDFAAPAVSFCNYSNFIPDSYDEVFELDKLALNQEGVKTKVDMFFHLAGINPNEVSSEEKRPKMICKPNEADTAERFFASKRLDDRINVAVTVESFNPKSPRSMGLEPLTDTFFENSNINFLILGRNPMRCPIMPNVLNWTGNTPTLERLIGVVDRCDAVITIDTGMMHLAGALGKQTLTIFGPTRPEFLASFYTNMVVLDANRECSPCWERGCENICTPTVPPSLVKSSFQDVLNGYDGYRVLDFKGEIIYESY